MKLIYAFVAWLLLPFATSAQILKPVNWSFATSKSTVAVGDIVNLTITATVRDGYHIYSSETNPKIDGPLPTVVTFTPNKTFELVGKLKPVSPVETKYEEAFEGDTYIMHGLAKFVQKVKILAPDPQIGGNVSFQACTDKDGQCIPGEEDFTITGLTVSSPAGKPTLASAPTANSVVTQPTLQTVVAATTPTATSPASGSAAAVATVSSPTPPIKVDALTASPPETTDTSLLGFVIAAFLSGLVALLTPCVYPIIPMTVSFFTNQQGGQWKALLYGASIIGIYVLFGTVIAYFFGQAAPNFFSTHWLPNLIFFGVFVFFALSFLGLFEIVLPSSLVNRIDAQSEKGGLFGIFFMAFTLVLVSFSCTGPIVGTILGLSSQGQLIKPVLGMVGFSSAFAIPFTLFAAFPRWLKSMPKSGGWLNSVKVVLGFLELALALKFLSTADQVYHWGILDREVFLAFWIVIFALIGFYFLGKVRLPHDTELKTVSVPRLLLAILTFAFVVYMIPGLWGAPLRALSGYLPPKTTQDFDLYERTAAVKTGNTLSETPKYANLFRLPHNLEGFFDYKQALVYAKKVNKPVFIDFTGHGCVNCREMEDRVWSDPAVLSRLQNDFVLVALYVDDKTELPESDWYTSPYDNKVKKTIGAQNTDLEITRYNNNAQPHYCLVDTDGKLLVAPKNYDRNIEHFIAFLDEGKSKF